MYDSIKKAIFDEFVPDTSNMSLEQAYEVIYRLYTRLQDMDDFSTDLLSSMKAKMDSGASFRDAFANTINQDYEFANFDYFKDAFYKYEEDLKRVFNDAMNSDNPAEYWNNEITWMASHAVVNFEGTDYTIDQLMKKIGDER